MKRNKFNYWMVVLLYIFCGCTQTSDCLSWEEYSVAVRKCPGRSQHICVFQYPLKLFTKSRVYLVTDLTSPISWGGFIIFENSFGGLTPLYHYWGPPNGCPNADEESYQQKLIDAVNQMIRIHSVDLTNVNHTDFVNDIMVCLGVSVIYDTPDKDGSLWKRYPKLFSQDNKPVDMKQFGDGYLFTYVTSYAPEMAAAVWKLHTKRNGEIISIDSKYFNGVLEKFSTFTD